jgi:hypothetical protein
MKKLYVLSMVTSLLVGVSIGYHADHMNIVAEQKNSTKEQCSQVEFYDSMMQDINTIELYDTSELTEETLTNRNGKIIIEKVIGKVTNYKLDGTILNGNANNGTYINYKRVEGAKTGDKIVTYFIYNPFTNIPDDVLTRLDFVIDDNSI